MKTVLLGLLLSTVSICKFGLADVVEVKELRGVIQYERKCILAKYPNGCLRMVVRNDENRYFFTYIDRPDHAATAEFNIMPFGGVNGMNLYQVFFTNLNSVLLGDDQPVRILGKIQLHRDKYGSVGSGVVTEITDIMATAHLDNK